MAEPREAAPSTASPPEGPAVETSALLARGNELLKQADVASARSFFRLAAQKGSAAGALALAASFDPVALKQAGILGARNDPGEALAWYRRAGELGAPEADGHRDRLIAYLRTAAAGGDAKARETLDRQP